MNVALFASIAALCLGPLGYSFMKSARMAALVDAFALVSVGGLVLAHVLPQSFAIAGWLVLPVAVLGLFGPGLLCGTKLFAGRSSERVIVPLALVGIALHAVLDGVALMNDPEGHGPSALALAVVLHRLPVGLGIWWLVRPAYGVPVAVAFLATIAVGSVVGYGFGEALVGGASETWFALVQALVAGSLLHVILKHPPHVHAATSGRLASGVGGLLGFALILGLESLHLESVAVRGTSTTTFLSLALQSAPALLFAYVAVGLMHALYVDLRALLGGGTSFGQAIRGTLAGLPMPVCSCGVIPLYNGLIQQRVPTPAAMSFLVATPELGAAALFLSWELLGGGITLARAGAATAVALAVGWFVGRRAGIAPGVALAPEPTEVRPPWSERLRNGLRYGFGDMVDGTAPWILVGLGLAAALEPLLSADGFGRLAPGVEVPLFALIGLPLYVCASGSTPLAAVLIAKGASAGAAIAFLLTGPATNITTFGVLARLHGRRIAVAFAAVTVAATIALGYAINAFAPGAASTVPVDLHEHGATWLQIASLVALGAVFAVSFLRQGTRGFVAQVISPHGASHAHDHDHDHGGDDDAAHACCHA